MNSAPIPSAGEPAPHAAPTALGGLVARLVPDPIGRALHRRPWCRAPLAILVLLAAFVALDRLVLRAGRLPDSAHFEPLLFVELLRAVGWPSVAASLALLAVLARFGALLAPWSAFDDRPSLRVFVVFVAFILVWPITTTEFNLYLDEGHFVDRAMVAGLLVALWFRPVFVLPLIVLLSAMIFQLAVPQLGGSILAHKTHVLHVLNLFAAALILHAVTGKRWTIELIFVCCCMVAGAYVTAAFAKLELGWWGHAQLYLMPASAYAHGWLDFLGAEGIGKLSAWLKPLDAPMQLVVLVVEGGCLLFLLRKSVSVWLLVAVVVFHVGVVALYGFFFWTWILVDLALAGLLFVRPDVLRETGAGLAGLALSAILIATSVHWSGPPRLGWFDTGLTYTYRLEAIGESGDRYDLRPSYFAPYGDVFTMGSFHYLSRTHPVLTTTYGVTKNREIAEGIVAAGSPDELFALEAAAGRAAYRAEHAERFARFVARFVKNRNAHGARPPSAALLGPPRQFISHREGVSDNGIDPIEEIIVREVTTWFDGERPREIRAIEVARITPG